MNYYWVKFPTARTASEHFYAELTTRLTQNNDSLFTSEVKIFRSDSLRSKEYLRVIEESNTVNVTQVSKLSMSLLHMSVNLQSMCVIVATFVIGHRNTNCREYLFVFLYSGCRKCVTLPHKVKEWPCPRALQYIMVPPWVPQGSLQWNVLWIRHTDTRWPTVWTNSWCLSPHPLLYTQHQCNKRWWGIWRKCSW